MKKFYFLLFGLCFYSVNAQIINFTNGNFKARLLAADVNTGTVTNFSGNFFRLDANYDGQIQLSEALLVKEMNIAGQNGSNSYTNMVGIENFTNMQSLTCGFNPLTSLDISNLIQLKKLVCSGTQINSLNLSTLVNLEELDCGNNPQLISLIVNVSNIINTVNCKSNNLTSLDLSVFPNLKSLDCSYNQLTNINLSNFPNFENLTCSNNLLNSLNINGLTNLKVLECGYNSQLPLINFSNFPNLQVIDCSQNFLQDSVNVFGLTQLSRLQCDGLNLYDLDLSSNSELFWLICSNNQLTTLELNHLSNLKFLICNNNILNTLFVKGMDFEVNGIYDALFDGNPNLNYICANDNMINYFQNRINAYNYTNCQVNTYCSFTPGGTFYRFQGVNTLDLNTNGCDLLDIVFPNLKFNINDGTNYGISISNSTGNFSIPLQTGTFAITPFFENPTYFNVSPPSVNVSFPTQTSPFTQNFCVTPNGVRPDLEITILPIIPARPGFDAIYKIIYKNKGNTTQSGTVNLTFNDAVLDLVSATPVTTSQSLNNLSWAFTNLQPFQTREITFTLNVNSPMETPAVNSSDILNYSATITSPAIDEIPSDNTFAYNQTVVNSYDPNDKTCLEGNTIPPSKVGDYVYYMIRFENNGTANAQNVVIKDMIDTSKFEINTLVPIKGSHSFVTNISSGNKVEFIFENINLPFNDATNDGYVSFKIKTKSSLVLGNTFSNTASIYFDYNFPIVTNTATTTVAVLAVKDFEFSNYFALYPNPVSDILNIKTNSDIQVKSITIYNTLGQLVLVIPNAQDIQNVDVSSLNSGNYFIKLNTDKGTSNTRFIKN